VVDGRKRVVVGLSVSPANYAEGSDAIDAVDQAVKQTGISPETVCADSAYASGENSAGFDERGIRFISPPRLPRNGTGTKYFTIEDFTYDEQRDVFICPGGHILHNVGRMAGHPSRRKYRGSALACKQCELKSCCTKASQRCVNVSIYHASLVRLRADRKTEDFKQLYRSRAPSVEGVFAEAKQWHGLRRAWRRGLSKMRVQCLLISAVINLKRLVGLFWPWNNPNMLYNAVIRAIIAFLQAIQPNKYKLTICETNIPELN
jgi:hypothetical protein